MGWKRNSPAAVALQTVRKCGRCGEPTTKKYCDRCVENRFGVIVKRDVFDPHSMQGWQDLGHGGLRRRNPYAGGLGL